MMKSVLLVVVCVMVVTAMAQKPPPNKKCMKKGTVTWTACSDGKMTQSLTSTVKGCSTDPYVTEFACTYTKTRTSEDNDCSMTITDDLTPCATDEKFNRTFSQTGDDCEPLEKEEVNLRCDKPYKPVGKPGGDNDGDKGGDDRGKKCMKKGTFAWTACADGKMTQSFTSTVEGCSTDPYVTEYACTYTKTRSSEDNDCSMTVTDDLTPCATDEKFTRTFSQTGDDCEPLEKEEVNIRCDKPYKPVGKPGGDNDGDKGGDDRGKKCMKEGTTTWTACADDKMTQSFTSTVEGCSTDPYVTEFACTYSKTTTSRRNDCSMTVTDDLTACATDEKFTRTFSQTGDDCEPLEKEEVNLRCDKPYKPIGGKPKDGENGSD